MSVDLHFLEPGAYLAVGISPQLLGGQVVEAPRFFKKLAHRVGSEISVRAKFGRNLLVAAASDGVGEQRGTLTGKRQGDPRESCARKNRCRRHLLLYRDAHESVRHAVSSNCRRR